jgi:hypothetical protein
VTMSATKSSGLTDEALEPVDPEVDVAGCGGGGGGASGAPGDGVGTRVPLLVTDWPGKRNDKRAGDDSPATGVLVPELRCDRS